MKNFLESPKIRSAARVALLAAAAFASGLPAMQGALAQSASDPFAFEKKALKPDGTPWTGPVNVGDTIKYVLSYKPGATKSGPVTITDTISANQSYVAPLTLSPGWTNTNPPYGTGKKTTYTHPGFGPGLSVMMDVTFPEATAQSGGDGTFPIPIGSKMYGITHHSSNAHIQCWNLADFSSCGSVATNLQTINALKHVVIGNKIYFPAVNSNTLAPGIGCWDVSNGQSAPCSQRHIPIPGLIWNAAPENADILSQLSGVAFHESSPDRLYVFATKSDHKKGNVYCISPQTGQICLGWALPDLSYSGNSPFDNGPKRRGDIKIDEKYPNKIFVLHDGRISCVDAMTGIMCGPEYNFNNNNMQLISAYDASMNFAMMCASYNAGNPIECVDSNGSQTTEANFKTFIETQSGGYSWSSFIIPGTSRAIYASRKTAHGVPICFDFLLRKECITSDFDPKWINALAKTPVDYGYAKDTLPGNEAKCILGLGDGGGGSGGIPWRFGYKGEYSFHDLSRCDNKITKKLPKLELFCGIKPNSAKWDKIIFHNAPSQLTGGTIKVTTGGGLSQTVTFTNPNNVGSLNLDATGANDTITIEYEPTYSSAPDKNAYKIEFTLNSDVGAQICYQTKVDKCGEEVSNTAVMTGSGASAAVNVTKKVSLGIAAGPGCVEPPSANACLAFKGAPRIVCGDKPGTYVVTLRPTDSDPNFNPTAVEITSLTPGVTVSPSGQAVPLVNGEVKVTISGAAPGSQALLHFNALAPGKGKSEGTDTCCEGDIRIDLPKEPCPPPKLDIALEKAWDKERSAFVIKARNRGDAITAPQAITIVDQVPAGLRIDSLLAPSAASWSCTPSLPITGAAPLTCAYIGAMPVAAGQALPDLLLKATLPQGLSRVVNCASAGVVSRRTGMPAREANPGNNEACAVVSNPQTVDLALFKTYDKTNDGPVASVYSFDLAVTNKGSAIAAPGVITVTDNLPVGLTVASIDPASAAAWACTPNANIPGGTAINCVYNGPMPVAAGAALPKIRLVLTAPPPAGMPAPTNCASVLLTSNNAQVAETDINNNKSCAQAQINTIVPVGTGVPLVTPTLCPPGTTRNLRGECIRSRVVCQPGQVLNAAGVCVAEVRECPPNQIWSPATKSCVPKLDRPPRCDAATAFLRGDECVCRYKDATPVSASACACPAGTKLRREIGACVPDASCPRGERFNGKECVKIETDLVCDRRSAVKRGDECVCRFDGMQKRSDTACACPEGTSLVGRRCVVPPPKCEPGQVLRNGKCVDIRPHCEPPQILIRNRCVDPRPDCKDGQVFNPVVGRCVDVRPKCEAGQILVRGRCVEIKQECRPPAVFNPAIGRCVIQRSVCGPGQIIRNGECVSPRNVECEKPLVFNPAVGRCVEPRRPGAAPVLPQQHPGEGPRLPQLQLPVPRQ